MLSEELKQKLTEHRPKKNENIGKLVYSLHRYLATRLEERCSNNYLYKVTPSHVALLANVYKYGGNNKGLASMSFVSKQAMSKLIKETLKEGIIEIEKDKNDNRANTISLTDKGGELLLHIWENSHLMMEDFEKHLGVAKSQQLLDLMTELSDSIGLCGSSDKRQSSSQK